MKKLLICLVFTTFLFSCSGGGDNQGGNGETKVEVTESAINIEEVKKEEIQTIKTQLNSENYSLSLEELNQLKSEGVLSEADYLELSNLAAN